MTGPHEPQTLHPSAEAEQAVLYQTLGGFLQNLLVRKFQVPMQDAVLLVHEAFNVYYGMKIPARDARAWLIGAACQNAHTWLRMRGLPTGNEVEVAREAATVLSYRDALESLPPTAREALRLRFAEKTYPEIAEELGVSTYAAERIVAKALARLRGVLRGR